MSDVLTASEKERLKRISPDLGGVTGQGVSLQNILSRLASQADMTAVELLTAMLQAAGASTPSQLELYEATDNGTNKVTIEPPPSLSADRTVSLPDEDVDLGDLGKILSGNATITNGTTSVNVNVGAAFNTKIAVVAFGEDPGTATIIWSGPVSGGNLPISVDQDPGADIVVHYVLDGR